MQHRGPGFTEKLRAIAADEVPFQENGGKVGVSRFEFYMTLHV